MSLILGEIKKVKLPPHKDFSVSLSVAKKWIKSSLEDVLKVLSSVAKRYRSPQPPLKRGALIPVPPFLRGVRKDLKVSKVTVKYFIKHLLDNKD